MDRISSAGLGPRGGSGERHSGNYNTIDEIEFLNDMPRLMANRAGGKTKPRKQSDVKVLGQYRQYLNTCMYRQDWGEINKKKVLEHCRKLMHRYARRAHKTAYR